MRPKQMGRQYAFTFRALCALLPLPLGEGCGEGAKHYSLFHWERVGVRVRSIALNRLLIFLQILLNLLQEPRF